MSASVLLIDDDDSVATVMAMLLQRQGLSAEAAVTARGAQQRLLSGTYDAILCDVHMSEMSGLELFSWLRAQRPDLAHAWVFMTGDSFDPVTFEFVTRWAIPCLQKPASMQAILRAIEDVRLIGV